MIVENYCLISDERLRHAAFFVFTHLGFRPYISAFRAYPRNEETNSIRFLIRYRMK